MAITISSAFVEQYTETVRHLAQQGDSRVRPHVTEVSSNAEKYNWDRLSQTSAVEKTAARVSTDTIFVDAPWTRRVSIARTFHWADTIENADKVQMLIDPQSSYAVNGGMAMRRSIDILILDSLIDPATDGDGNLVDLPAGQIIGNAANPMSLDLITEVNEKFQSNDVDPDEPKVWVITPAQVRQMLNIGTLTSADYQTVRALSANGMIHNFMGFTWVLSNKLLGVPEQTAHRTIAFTKRALGLAVNNDIFVRIAERPDLSHLIQVYMEWTMGAVRVEDEHVVEVTVDSGGIVT